ncbi:DUF1566 domain-containing protein [Methylicorpusculum sp.]|uniref:Lcl C-terminal domain-containing protein n=1 Tax=Methylicorpusculum sp. TaxID=2713644 RepID=UPI00271B641B|nr:DUF1566 domain-containing protein [Methylicorpusculum sp.]MDO8843832.1 DUF1566 domain-containing protein [Methylicorpusculum sp.]
MSFNKRLITTAGLLLSLTTLNAEAVLTPYIAVDGSAVVYSSVSNVTWTQDANLFKTMYDADNSLISQIASVRPSYNDPFFGLQTIGADDFNTGNGQLTWWGGLAFTNYLNSINYGGSSQWALPSADYNQTSGLLGQLYYNELNALGHHETNGSDFGILGDGSFGTSGNAGPFTNAQTSAYWLATEDAYDPRYAWLFYTDGGLQLAISKDRQFYAWPVSPGQVAAVPVPGAMWLLGSGLLGLLSFTRMKKQKS